jgi:hypothetical protein
LLVANNSESILGYIDFIAASYCCQLMDSGCHLYDEGNNVGKAYNNYKKSGKGIKTPHMSLFPNEDVLTKEIESWKRFADN